VGDGISRHMEVAFDNMYGWEGIWEKEWGVNNIRNDKWRHFPLNFQRVLTLVPFHLTIRQPE
jgi:hypothetical protein